MNRRASGHLGQSLVQYHESIEYPNLRGLCREVCANGVVGLRWWCLPFADRSGNPAMGSIEEFWEPGNSTLCIEGAMIAYMYNADNLAF